MHCGDRMTSGIQKPSPSDIRHTTSIPDLYDKHNTHPHTPRGWLYYADLKG